jgi:Fe-S-cluster containining protein
MTVPESLLTRLFSQYRELCNYCDNLFAATNAYAPDAISCREGCCECCELETVNALEASILSLAAQRSIGEHHRSPMPRIDRCILLENGLCSLYSQRPIICRTHGLAFKRFEGSACSIHHCPCNFRLYSSEELLASPHIIDEETISANLARLNIAFCRIIDMPQITTHRFTIAAILKKDLPTEVTAAARQSQLSTRSSLNEESE